MASRLCTSWRRRLSSTLSERYAAVLGDAKGRYFTTGMALEAGLRPSRSKLPPPLPSRRGLRPWKSNNEDVKTLMEHLESKSLQKQEDVVKKILQKQREEFEDYKEEVWTRAVDESRRIKVKKILRLDPLDYTAKRREDDDLGRKKSQKTVNKPLSQNAKFRAIPPSAELREYIDTNCLGKRRLVEWRAAGYNIKLHAPLDNVPFTKTGRHKIQQSVFRNKLVFVAAAKHSTSIPVAELPEIAFAGRTNSGKSSLLNALTRRWGTARTAEKPGLTQSINFYTLGTKLCLVDLPGYGFAYAKEEKMEAWQQLTQDFVTVRDLKRICVLLDARWPVKKSDYEFIEFLEKTHRKYQIIISKTDLVLPLDLARRATQIQTAFKDGKCLVRPILMVSSKSGAGIGKLRKSLVKVLDTVKT